MSGRCLPWLHRIYWGSHAASVVVATSARIKQELETLAGRSLPQVIVKPNAIDAGQFPRNEFSRTISGPCRIVTVSRIHPKKGLTHLLDAAELLLERGVAATVSILGAPDADDTESCAYYNEVRERVEKRNMGAIVRLEGQKSSVEVRRYLAEADIFVAPFVELPNGDKDGIPTALLEAMASGCAIVATNAGSITEVVRNGMEGIVVPQRDANALAQAIVKLIQDDGLRLRISRAAFERVVSEFDIRQCEGLFHGRVHAAIKGGAPNIAGSVATI
jgi:colanic acid/amylovoran biosynthesis glycosyltransferase